MKKKTIIIVGIVLLFFVIGFFVYKNVLTSGNNNGNNTNNIKETEKTICTLNEYYISNKSFYEYWNKNANITLINDEKNKNILQCSKVIEKDKTIFNVVKSNVPTFIKTELKENNLVENGVNESYITKNIDTIQLDGNKPFFIYKKATPFTIKFKNLLAEYKRNFSFDYTLEEVTGMKGIKYKGIFAKYGDEIIISNYRYFININPDEKEMIKKILKDEKFNKLIELEDIFNNAFVEKDIFIIIKDIEDVLKKRN